MKRTVKLMRKAIIAAIGFPLLALGIVFIPLPGPGFLICFIALLILSLEFDWVRPYLDKLKAQFKKIVDTAKEKQRDIDNKYHK